MSEETIAARIRRARLAARLSTAELARRVHVSKAAAHQWETGETKGLRPENLIRVSDELGVEPRWLALGTGPMRPGQAPEPTPLRPEVVVGDGEGRRFRHDLDEEEDVLLSYYRTLPSSVRPTFWTLLRAVLTAVRDDDPEATQAPPVKTRLLALIERGERLCKERAA